MSLPRGCGMFSLEDWSNQSEMAAKGGGLEEIFMSFCSFGAGSKDVAPLMDGAKFGKLFRDQKLLDKKLTPTDVDIIFTRAKGKTERKINYDQFVTALRMCAEVKYPKDAGAMKKLEQKLLGGAGPKTVNPVRTANKDNVDRLTDTSLYTGSHKQRFDEEGKGKGLAGRDSTPKGSGSCSPLVSGREGYVAAYKGDGTYNKDMKQPSKPKSGDVLDRLTDSSKYTGSHKQRFDDSGKGRGMAGRDLPAKGSGMSPGSASSQAAYVSGYKQEGTYGKK